MEPPTDYQSPHDHAWEDSRQYSPHQRQQQQQQQQHYSSSREQTSSSRGRSSSRYQTPSSSNVMDNNKGGRLHQSISSSSNTPRRKGNPQSSSPNLDGRNQHQQQQHQQQQQLKLASSSPSSPQSQESQSSLSATATASLTPLTTLSTILLTHQSNVTTTLQLYRQSHSLHRHATERTTIAKERLREAQAELEHATTAQEFALEELNRTTLQKNEAQREMKAMCKRIRGASKEMANKRVKLVRLNKNVMWNGRLGTIVKLVTDGSNGNEDVGRWKVKLDTDWRGRDAEGQVVSEEQQQQQNVGGEGSMNVVVAKAENLELLVEEDDCFGNDNNMNMDMLVGDGPARSGQQHRSTSRSRSASSQKRHQRYQQHQQQQEDDIQPSKSRDPEQEEYDAANINIIRHRSRSNNHRPARDPSMSPARNNHATQQPQPTVAVTPESRGSRNSSSNAAEDFFRSSNNIKGYKNITPTSHYKSETDGRYHEKKNNTSSPMRQRMRNSKMQQPTKEFNPEEAANNGDSFQQWVSPENDYGGGQGQRRQGGGGGGGRSRQSQSSGHRGQQQQQQQQQFRPYGSSPGDVVSVAGSFFDEVTSLEKSGAFPYNDNNEHDNADHHNNDNNHDEEFYSGEDHHHHGETSSIPHQLQPHHPIPETAPDGHTLPNIVILPVPEDDYSNPFLSPGYVHSSSSSPPHCVGVQNAGIPHVNGVYLLAYPKDEYGNAIVNNNHGGGESMTPPLYFRDGPPILLSDNRQYDMCILRINCPDSPDHVIWFLARVDVDPNCLDVKFSDCYYYCRMLRNDDGCGGEIVIGEEDEMGVGGVGPCQTPPSRGWNVPRLPPGVEMLRIANPSDASLSTMSGGGTNYGGGSQQYGLGIGPRYPNGGGEEEERMEPGMDFVSPGVDSGYGSSKMSMSKYSI
ncbi:hypothetical protein ACHAXR_005625 [Thalassiosira sp. AJA248-18]